MKIVNYIAMLLLFVNLAMFASAQREEKKKADQAVPVVVYNEGVVYALPRTGITITVRAKKTHFLPGPYNQYAERYLGIRGAKAQESEQWEIVELKADQISEADPNAFFKAMAPSLLAQLPSGVIRGINVKGECSVNSLVGNDFIAPEITPAVPFTDLSSDEFYDLVVDPVTGKETFDLKTEEERARDAAAYLVKLRKKRSYAILNANDVVPEDGKGYEVFVSEAQRLEKEYVSLFIGKEIVTEHEFAFSFIPGESSVKNEVLFRFSPEKGVLPKTDISGKPILLELTKDEAAFSAIDKLKKSDNPKAGEAGVFYRIPCVAGIKLSDGLTTLYTGRLLVNQFGVVVPFPEKLLDGKHQINFNTETGSIKDVLEVNN
jgi:hypothetical protein